MTMTNDRRRMTRDEVQIEETTRMDADSILELVRANFQARNPTAKVRQVRWSLDGIAIDHASAAMAG